jgi:NADH:ubiquinone oxidoreductase subunit H
MLIYALIPVLINIILMLLLTLIIAATTLVERKVLSLMQRRVGPNFVGYKGRLQYIADALKLFIKGALVPDEANKFFFVTIPAIVLAISYSFWMNAVWGPSISIFEIEFNIVYASLFSALFSLCVILTGYFSKNKYAMISAIRTGVGMLNLELFLGLMFLNVILISESFSFMNIVVYQEIYWSFILFFLLLGLITITFLLEVGRAPFDLSEAESELVAGYMTEYGGFYFGVFYLGEYLHLFLFSLIISTLFLGGWELPNFLNIFMLKHFNNVHDVFSHFLMHIAPLEVKTLASAYDYYYCSLFQWADESTEEFLALGDELCKNSLNVYWAHPNEFEIFFREKRILEHKALLIFIKVYGWLYWNVYINICAFGVFLYYFFIY